jgi:hypothetical protein
VLKRDVNVFNCFSELAERIDVVVVVVVVVSLSKI